MSHEDAKFSVGLGPSMAIRTPALDCRPPPHAGGVTPDDLARWRALSDAWIRQGELSALDVAELLSNAIPAMLRAWDGLTWRAERTAELVDQAQAQRLTIARLAYPEDDLRFDEAMEGSEDLAALCEVALQHQRDELLPMLQRCLDNSYEAEGLCPYCDNLIFNSRSNGGGGDGGHSPDCCLLTLLPSRGRPSGIA